MSQDRKSPAHHERALQYLIDSVTDHAIYMLDLEGRVVSWNPGAERLKGYTKEEIEGESFSRFFPLDQRLAGVPEKLLEEARRTGRTEREGWRIRKDGSRFWALATIHSIRDEHGELLGFAKVTRDMSAHREAMRTLAESERRFRLLVDGVIDYAIYMLDANGMITNWNKGAERMKGYRPDEVIGRHFSMFYTPQDRQAGLPARALKTALEEGRFEIEGWRVRKDGGRFWASAILNPIHDEQGKLIGFAKITRDISQKKAAEEALAQSERQFRMLVTGVVDYALCMLDPNGIVTNWNAGAEHIKGYRSEEIVGQHFSRFYTEPERAAGVPIRALQIASEKGRYEAEGWRVRKNGELFWASVVIDAIRDENGELVGYAKITRDITDKRNAQLELQRAHEKLGQAQKMEALGQLTGGVAHDFNNLLMVVSGQAQLLRRHLGDDPRASRALDAIEASSKRGQELTRHLLTFARRQRLRPTSFSLGDQSTGLRELLAASVSANIRFEMEVPDQLWPVRVDPSELELALLNLTVNARDAMAGGGELTISARNTALMGDEFEDAAAGDYVEIKVSDTGGGIPPDILPRIFEPFFTTKDVDKGTGLGLSQVYGFVRQSGGHVRLETELGVGTCFTLYLPRADEETAAPAEEAVHPQAGAAEILLVEDNPDVADVTAELLEQLGHRVRTAANAQAALRMLAEETPPDLVLSDVVMAGELDGLGLAREVRSQYPAMPVLLATGYSQAIEKLGDEFPVLRKPYLLSDLSRAVNAALSTPIAGGEAENLVSIAQARRARGERRD